MASLVSTIKSTDYNALHEYCRAWFSRGDPVWFSEYSSTIPTAGNFSKADVGAWATHFQLFNPHCMLYHRNPLHGTTASRRSLAHYRQQLPKLRLGEILLGNISSRLNPDSQLRSKLHKRRISKLDRYQRLLLFSPMTCKCGFWNWDLDQNDGILHIVDIRRHPSSYCFRNHTLIWGVSFLRWYTADKSLTTEMIQKNWLLLVRLD